MNTYAQWKTIEPFLQGLDSVVDPDAVYLAMDRIGKIVVRLTLPGKLTDDSAPVIYTWELKPNGGKYYLSKETPDQARSLEDIGLELAEEINLLIVQHGGKKE